MKSSGLWLPVPYVCKSNLIAWKRRGQIQISVYVACSRGLGSISLVLWQCYIANLRFTMLPQPTSILWIKSRFHTQGPSYSRVATAAASCTDWRSCCVVLVASCYERRRASRVARRTRKNPVFVQRTARDDLRAFGVAFCVAVRAVWK